MSIDDIFAALDDPKMISGIHNYCDRWCERCAFTSHCVVYAAEQADPDVDPARHDINNAAFWQKLSSIFAETRQLIDRWAEESGVAFDHEELEEIGREQDQLHEDVCNHPLAIVASDYARTVADWFRPTETPEHSDTQHQTVSDKSDTGEYVEIILWYHIFIAAKLMRALQSVLADDDNEHARRDADGSAKVALIGIDRSLIAWKVLADAETDKLDLTQKIMLQLESLRMGAEQQFPHARDFIRPGLDELSPDVLQ